MASLNKKRLVPNADPESNINLEEEIQADFEGRNPESQDFHGIRQLLKQVFLKEHVDISQLCDMIISQQGIGSVLKQSWTDEECDEEDTLTETLDVFGITTVINLSSHQDTPVVQQLFQLMKRLTDENADEATKKQVEDILTNTNKIGLLINERFVNLPAKVADPLLSSLEVEVNRMAKKDSSYNFDYYVTVCKILKSKTNKSDIMYSNAEEEIFNKFAELSVDYNVASQCDTARIGQWEEGDTEMIPYRRVLFIDGNKFVSAIQKIKEFVA